jgi:hypothetical protein
MQVAGRFLAQVHDKISAPQANRLDSGTRLNEFHGVPITSPGVEAEMQLKGLPGLTGSSA